MDEWRIIDTGSNDAFFNMAVDEAIMISHKSGLVPPSIRFYQWNPPGLSLGYFQKAEKEVDLDACKRYNVDLVRRLTGGRAVLHDDELTYSIIINEKFNFLPASILKSYKIISEGIIKGLQSLGINAELKAIDGNKKKALQGFSAACFDTPSWYEIVVNDKKLVGSAQTRQKSIIVQHGSIPLTIDVDKLYNVLKIPNEKTRHRLKKRFEKNATAINYESRSSITIFDLKKSLIKGWEDTFKIKLTPGKLIPEEEKLIKNLIHEKYKNDEWNFKR